MITVDFFAFEFSPLLRRCKTKTSLQLLPASTHSWPPCQSRAAAGAARPGAGCAGGAARWLPGASPGPCGSESSAPDRPPAAPGRSGRTEADPRRPATTGPPSCGPALRRWTACRVRGVLLYVYMAAGSAVWWHALLLLLTYFTSNFHRLPLPPTFGLLRPFCSHRLPVWASCGGWGCWCPSPLLGHRRSAQAAPIATFIFKTIGIIW